MGFPCRFKSDFPHHIETIGLIPISVLFSFYRAISLILGINCLILGEAAFFSLYRFVNPASDTMKVLLFVQPSGVTILSPLMCCITYFSFYLTNREKIEANSIIQNIQKLLLTSLHRWPRKTFQFQQKRCLRPTVSCFDQLLKIFSLFII